MVVSSDAEAGQSVIGVVVRNTQLAHRACYLFSGTKGQSEAIADRLRHVCEAFQKDTVTAEVEESLARVPWRLIAMPAGQSNPFAAEESVAEAPQDINPALMARTAERECLVPVACLGLGKVQAALPAFSSPLFPSPPRAILLHLHAAAGRGIEGYARREALTTGCLQFGRVHVAAFVPNLLDVSPEAIVEQLGEGVLVKELVSVTMLKTDATSAEKVGSNARWRAGGSRGTPPPRIGFPRRRLTATPSFPGAGRVLARGRCLHSPFPSSRGKHSRCLTTAATPPPNSHRMPIACARRAWRRLA
jgi:hypothetical protein